MAANLYANEVIMAAELVSRHQVPADTEIHFFRPGPMVVIAEWLEGDETQPTGKVWRHYDLATGKAATGEEILHRHG